MTQGAVRRLLEDCRAQSHLEDCRAQSRPDTKKMYLVRLGQGFCLSCPVPWVNSDIPSSSGALGSKANPPGQRTWVPFDLT